MRLLIHELIDTGIEQELAFMFVPAREILGKLSCMTTGSLPS